MSQITCLGVVVTDTSGVPLCRDMEGAPAAWTVAPAFDVSNLDPLMVSGAFAAGFVLVATGTVMGWAVRFILSMLK